MMLCVSQLIGGTAPWSSACQHAELCRVYALRHAENHKNKNKARKAVELLTSCKAALHVFHSVEVLRRYALVHKRIGFRSLPYQSRPAAHVS